MFELEKEYYKKGYKLICGVDEAGRGPLCGPVVAACCILPLDFHNELINDSKKISEKKREEAFKIIIKNAIAYSLTYVDSNTIDKINIYQASKLAMKLSVEKLKIKPDLILTDAMKIDIEGIDVVDIIKGDAKCESIAAGSIIAKVCRDRYMKAISKKYPEYHFNKHKGYGTKLHLEMIKKYGPILNFHRFSYAPLKKIDEEEFEQLNLF